jgi:hypothetical protein
MAAWEEGRERKPRDERKVRRMNISGYDSAYRQYLFSHDGLMLANQRNTEWHFIH